MYVPRTSHLPEGLVPRLLLTRSEEVVEVYGFRIRTLRLPVISVMIIRVMRLSYNERTNSPCSLSSTVGWAGVEGMNHLKLMWNSLLLHYIISCVPFSKHNTNYNSEHIYICLTSFTSHAEGGLFYIVFYCSMFNVHVAQLSLELWSSDEDQSLALLVGPLYVQVFIPSQEFKIYSAILSSTYVRQCTMESTLRWSTQ